MPLIWRFVAWAKLDSWRRFSRVGPRRNPRWKLRSSGEATSVALGNAQMGDCHMPLGASSAVGRFWRLCQSYCISLHFSMDAAGTITWKTWKTSTWSHTESKVMPKLEVLRLTKVEQLWKCLEGETWNLIHQVFTSRFPPEISTKPWPSGIAMSRVSCVAWSSMSSA